MIPLTLFSLDEMTYGHASQQEQNLEGLRSWCWSASDHSDHESLTDLFTHLNRVIRGCSNDVR